MAFDLNKFDKLSAAANENVRTLWAYTDTTATLATLSASAYFNDVDHYLTIGDTVFMRGSDGTGSYEITAVSPNVTMEAATDPGALSETLSDGDIFVGNVSNVATGVTPSGDITLSNAGVFGIAAGAVVNADINASAAIAFSKLAALPSAQILVGNGSNVAAAVAMTGDVAISNAGVTTIQAGAVDASMINANTLQYASVTMSAAEFNGAYAAPHLLIAAAGPNTLIVLEQAQFVMTYGSAAFANGGVAHVQYDSTAHGAGVIASTTLAAATFTSTASNTYTMNAGVVALPFATTVNKGLYFSNITGAFDTGDSDFVVHLWYRVIPTV